MTSMTQKDEKTVRVYNRWAPWTDEEDNLLRELYPEKEGRSQLKELLPRTWESVKARASFLGVHATRFVQPENGPWTCLTCKVVKPISDYYKTKEGARNVYYCKECRRADRKKRWQEDYNGCRTKQMQFWEDNKDEKLEKQRAYHLKSKYGLSQEQYDDMFEAQQGLCKICNKPETKMRDGVRLRLAVDHDHACCPGKQTCGKCVRHLLCINCNWTIGVLELHGTLDSIIKYLAKKEDIND